jgi:hypothetical protein
MAERAGLPVVIAAAVRALTRCGLASLLAVGLNGCVGLVRTQLDWVGVTSETRTKTEVLARFGEPRRRTHEAGREVWYYHLLEPGPSGRRPATEGATIVYALLAPMWWRTQPDDNVAFAFDGDALAEARELRTAEGGFFCGVNLAHRHLVSCGRVP